MSCHPIRPIGGRRGVSKGVEDNQRLPALCKIYCFLDMWCQFEEH
jgi:hypothetical protein